MPLIALWESNSSVIDQFSIEQVVATAGLYGCGWPCYGKP